MLLCYKLLAPCLALVLHIPTLPTFKYLNLVCSMQSEGPLEAWVRLGSSVTGLITLVQAGGAPSGEAPRWRQSLDREPIKARGVGHTVGACQCGCGHKSPSPHCAARVHVHVCVND